MAPFVNTVLNPFASLIVKPFASACDSTGDSAAVPACVPPQAARVQRDGHGLNRIKELSGVPLLGKGSPIQRPLVFTDLTPWVFFRQMFNYTGNISTKNVDIP